MRCTYLVGNIFFQQIGNLEQFHPNISQLLELTKCTYHRKLMSQETLRSQGFFFLFFFSTGRLHWEGWMVVGHSLSWCRQVFLQWRHPLTHAAPPGTFLIHWTGTSRVRVAGWAAGQHSRYHSATASPCTDIHTKMSQLKQGVHIFLHSFPFNFLELSWFSSRHFLIPNLKKCSSQLWLRKHPIN